MIHKDGGSIQEALIKITKIVQPKTIRADHEPGSVGNEFSVYLHEKQIPLNVNALGDHHALGIINNFAGRSKEILTRTFLNKNITRWINSIGAINNHYNK